MAQPIYSTSVVIDEFKGLNQTGDGANMSLKYAAETENVNVHNGSFSQMRQGKPIDQILDKPIGTLAYLSRRFVENPDTLLVAISNGRVFTKELDGDDDWVQRFPPLVNTAGEGEDPVYVEDGDPLTENDCDWVTYESNIYPYYSTGRPYVVGERCSHEETLEPLSAVFTGVEVYYFKRARAHEETEWDTTVWANYSIGSNNFVPVYDAESTYVRNEYCVRDETASGATEKTYKIYRCNTSIDAPEEWTSDHWSEYLTLHPFKAGTYNYGDKVVVEKYEVPEDTRVPEIIPYICTTAITTPKDWDEDDWEAITDNETVDILIFTNAKDGMYCLYGDTLQVSPVWVTPDPVNNPTENIKFGVIARYNERIWGSGIDGEPDKLMYSVPYSPFDWTPSFDIPEDGAGDISQPTWDGDSFVSVHQSGSDLLSVKRNSIWRIYGTHPGEFTMVKQYGGGTIQENTFVVKDQYAYMLGEHGLLRYDGTGAYAFLQDAIQRFMRDNVDHSKLNLACAAMRGGIYCLALPINGSSFCNAILEYDTNENTFSLRTDISVDSFLQYNERLFYTSATEPGKVFELQDDIGVPLPCKWISGYQDLGLKNSIKSAFILYMMVESEAPVELRVGIRTEKKFKQKIIYTKPKKMTRLHLNTQGRTFRLEIESFSGIPFTIAGGIKLDLELDPD